MDTVNKDVTEYVGKFEMRVATGDPTQETKERWGQRADALTSWLMAEWDREQAALKEAC